MDSPNNATPNFDKLSPQLQTFFTTNKLPIPKITKNSQFRKKVLDEDDTTMPGGAVYYRPGTTILMRNFINNVRQGREKFKFNDPLSKIRKLYAFCNEIDTDAETDGYTTLNHDYSYATSWIESQINELANSRNGMPEKITFITGDIGCGKSSFIKFMLREHEQKFLNQKDIIIPTRIEFDRFREWVDRFNRAHPKLKFDVNKIDRRALTVFIKLCMVRDFLHYTSTHPESYNFEFRRKLTNSTSHFQAYLRRTFVPNNRKQLGKISEQSFIESAVKRFGAITEHRDELIKLFAERVSEFPDTTSPGKYFLKVEDLDNLPDGIASVILMYACQRYRAKFMIFLDGIDMISPRADNDDSFTHTLIDSLFTIPKSENPLKLSTPFRFDIPYSLFYVARTNTYNIANATRPRTATLRFEKLGITVAPFSSIIEKRVEYAISATLMGLSNDINSNSHPNLIQWIKEFGRFVADTLNCPDFDLVKLFQGNVRDSLRFYIQLLNLVFIDKDFIPVSNSRTFCEDIHASMRSVFPKFMGPGVYRVFRTIMFGEDYEFRNWFRVKREDERKTIDEKYARNQGSTNYVDNIFEYIRGSTGGRKNHRFLLKIRILQMLNASPRPLKGVDLLRTLARLFNFKDYYHEVAWCLEILLHSELVRTLEHDENALLNGETHEERRFRIVPYELTQRGIFAINTLLYKLTYVEHSLLISLMPDRIVDFLSFLPLDPIKVDQTWRFNSAKNLYSFLAYLNWLEEQEREGAGEQILHDRLVAMGGKELSDLFLNKVFRDETLSILKATEASIFDKAEFYFQLDRLLVDISHIHDGLTESSIFD